MNESNEISFKYELLNGENFEVKIKEESGFKYNKNNKHIIEQFTKYEDFYKMKK